MPIDPVPNRHLTARRAFLGITQDVLSFRTKLSQSRICRIEKGLTEASEAEREAIAEALETTIAEVFPTPQPSAELAS